MSDKNNKISAMTVNDMKLVLSYSYSKIINSGSKLLLTVGFVRNQSEIFVR